MSAIQNLLRRLNELRKWSITPLGAVLLLALLAIIGFAALAASVGGNASQEERLRAYFVSPEGGGAPTDQAKLINVPECDRVGEPQVGYYVLRCTIEYRDDRLSSCFEFHEESIEAVPVNTRARPGCEARVLWSRAENSLIAR